MTSSSWLSRTAALGASSGALCAINKASLIVGAYGPAPGVLLDGVSLGLLAGAGFCLWRLTRTLEAIATVCGSAAQGDLEARILDLPEPGLVGRLQRCVNRMLDISDAFVREASGS